MEVIRQKLWENKKQLIITSGVIGAITIGIFLGVLLFKPITPIYSPLASDVLVETVEIAAEIPKNLEEVKTLGIALFGYGGAGHDGGYLTDAIQVLHINFEKSIIALISIPRDLWVKMPSGVENKINAAVISSATGNKNNLIVSGAPGLKKNLSDITGLNIDYFIGVDFVGFQRAIGNNLDGIEVEVGETLEDPWYPIKGMELDLCGKSPKEMVEVHAKYSGFELERQFECRYKHLLFRKGWVKMEGGDALEYVRSRHGSNEGDVSRGKRQQEVLSAIQKKLFSLNYLDNLPEFFTEIVKNTQTDIDLGLVQYLSPLLKNANNFKVVRINLGPSNVFVNSKASTGAFIMIPKEGVGKWDGVVQYIQGEINK